MRYTSIAFALAALLVLPALAENPTAISEKKPGTKYDMSALIYLLFEEGLPQPKNEPLDFPKFDINYRPVLPPTTQGSSAQSWSSFGFNGKTVWNRPTIFNKTPVVV